MLRQRPTPGRLVASGAITPGVLLALGGAGLALALHVVLPAVSPLLVAVVAGAAISNVATLRGGLPAGLSPGLQLASRRFLRIGIVLLGLQLVVGDLFGLGWPVLLGAIAVVAGGIGATVLAGRLLGVGRSQTLLIACGFSICGAAAVAGVDGVLRKRNSDETATAVALVVIFGTAMIGVLPLASMLLGLDQHSAGVWAGASVHEVAQVVATAGIIGVPALEVAVVVKLARVLMLAPVLAVVCLVQRRDSAEPGRPPLVPVFVLGFLGAVAVRSLELLPGAALDAAALVQTLLLSAAMFALGTSVHWRVLHRASGRTLALAAIATAVVGLLGLATAALG